ncbi:hypothetical protein BpHYR1_029301 [Brachionus plicatilis]|uniref:Uncharacterized protein n=1 Tax=Brachionus plicatilis TaxID=10195 RepID=A0A3M7PAP6_BRAPC|nr:hypothetical protein BpHYR1_029301 [Brachionus plicatilis]
MLLDRKSARFGRVIDGQGIVQAVDHHTQIVHTRTTRAHQSVDGVQDAFFDDQVRVQSAHVGVKYFLEQAVAVLGQHRFVLGAQRFKVGQRPGQCVDELGCLGCLGVV